MGEKCLYAQKVSKVYKKVLSQHLKVKTTFGDMGMDRRIIVK